MSRSVATILGVVVVLFLLWILANAARTTNQNSSNTNLPTLAPTAEPTTFQTIEPTTEPTTLTE